MAHTAHSHGCAHHHHSPATIGEGDTRRLLIVFCLIAGFAIVEVIGGIISGSLALLADAGHMVTDAMAIGLALWARQLAQKPATDRYPFGHTRAQVLAAFVNGLALFVLIAFLLFESVERMLAPTPVLAGTMLTVAVLGLIVNAAAFAILHRGNTQDVNMRGALLHVIGDMLGSVAAITAALIISARPGWTIVDPIVTIAVCLLIGRSAFGLVKETGHILLEGAPLTNDQKPARVREELAAILAKGTAVSDLRLWMLTPEAVQAHVCLNVHPETDVNEVVAATKAQLGQQCGIEDVSVEVTVAPSAYGGRDEPSPSVRYDETGEKVLDLDETRA